MIVKPKLVSKVEKRSALKNTFSKKIFTPGESISPGSDNNLFKEIDYMSQIDKRIALVVKGSAKSKATKNSIKSVGGIVKTSMKVTKLISIIIGSIPLILCILVAVLLFTVINSLLPF